MFFFCSPKRAEALQEIQYALHLPELKITKPSGTRCLSHKRCVKATKKELLGLITTLQQLHEVSGDTEAYGLNLLLSQAGIASIMLLSDVLHILDANEVCRFQQTAYFFGSNYRLSLQVERSD